MKLLRDEDILRHIQTGNPIIKNIQTPNDWYSDKSPVQPSSIDLHIGDIFCPGKKGNEKGSFNKPLKEYIVDRGHTAVIRTKEHLEFPGNIAGYGFPPNRLSIKGLLMTNPGHIDPGYSGPMHFTIINMGKQSVTLRENDVIVTLLIFQLEKHAKCDLVCRLGGKKLNVFSQEHLDILNEDFMDIDKRAMRIASEITKRRVTYISLFGFIITIATILTPFFISINTYLKNVEGDIIRMQERINYIQKDKKVSKLESQLNNLENILKTKNIIKQ